MKMYILIRDSIPLGFATLAAAHASLAAYLEFKDRPETQAWVSGTFFKVVCKVTDAEFERAKGLGEHVVLTESKLDDAEVALAFKPSDEWSKAFKFFRLYR
ncbi:MAG: peptidyl-tRNA hydrolase [Acidobacteriota bacterium]